jgi:hypothetical protein
MVLISQDILSRRKYLVAGLIPCLLTLTMFLSDAPSMAGEPEKVLLERLLKKEADGLSVDRAKEIKDLAIESDDVIVRSNAGEILVDGKWTPVNKLSDAQLTPVIKQYLAIREGTSTAIEDQRRLARWCDSKGLT